LKPRHTARILGGRNRAEISLSFFEFFSEGERKRKIVRENFCEVATGAIMEAGDGAESVRFSFASPRAPRVPHLGSSKTIKFYSGVFIQLRSNSL